MDLSVQFASETSGTLATHAVDCFIAGVHGGRRRRRLYRYIGHRRIRTPDSRNVFQDCTMFNPHRPMTKNNELVYFRILISQLPKLCVKISILRYRRMWVRSFSTRLTSVTFAEDKVLIFLILRKNAKIVQL